VGVQVPLLAYHFEFCPRGRFALTPSPRLRCAGRWRSRFGDSREHATLPSMDQALQDSGVAQRVASYFRRQASPGVISVYLFGSHARGSAHRQSDIDVGAVLSRAVFPSASQRFDERVSLSAALVDALDHNEVDVVVLNDAPPLFARHIVTAGIRVFCRHEAADRDFVRDTQLRAADLAPFLRRTQKIKLEALRS